jgi:arabinofuranan 3-O-arabinosyltransferase
MTLSVDRAVAGQPFWLVLGESHNNGWAANVSGVGGLGKPALLDGYANGWLIKPARSGPLTVHLDWTPQHRVWIALGLSALAIVICLALVLWPVRRTWRWAGADPGDRASSLPALPVLATPARWTGRPLGRRASISTALAGTALAVVVIGPIPGVIIGAVLLAVLGLPRLRALLTVGSVTLLGLASLYVLELQWRYKFPAKIEWPERFHRVTLVPWVAVALLLADAVIEYLRARRRSSG